MLHASIYQRLWTPGHIGTCAEQGDRVLILAYLCLTWMEQKWSLMCRSPCALLVCFPGFFGQWLHSLNSSTDPTPHSNSQKDKEEARSNCKLQSTLNQLKLLTPLGIAESWPVKSQLLQLSHLECNWQNFQHHLQGTAWYFEQTLQV
jgi:hypothetical protein